MKINSLEQKIRRIKEKYADLPIILPPACDDEIESFSDVWDEYDTFEELFDKGM
ncbi:MAG: hypothetical protein FWB86_13525 [Treponema sp.]|nr:hypothetical protein [Treponema sp.]